MTNSELESSGEDEVNLENADVDQVVPVARSPEFRLLFADTTAVIPTGNAFIDLVIMTNDAAVTGQHLLVSANPLGTGPMGRPTSIEIEGKFTEVGKVRSSLEGAISIAFQLMHGALSTGAIPMSAIEANFAQLRAIFSKSEALSGADGTI